MDPGLEFSRQAIFVNHYYFYILAPEWGSSFIKTNAYAFCPIWVYLNGHELAKRQAARHGIDFTPLDNGFASCQDAQALADICGGLSEREIETFCSDWMRELSSPFTPGERSRYGYR